MGLHARRRGGVVWSAPAGPGGGSGFPVLRGSSGTRRIRRYLRIGGLLVILGLMRLARTVRCRWVPLLAGTVLTVAGLMLRSSPVGIIVVPGLAYLLIALVMDGGGEEERRRRAELARELAGYATTGQRNDLEATLDEYPDVVTCELREILAGQAGSAAGSAMIPGAGQH
jgi:hypothetical protein